MQHQAEDKHATESDRLDEFEARLLEQEHRPLAAIRNWLTLRDKYKPEDKRRRSLTIALIYTLLFSPATAATVGGLMGITTLGVLIWQNWMQRESNSLLAAQNRSQEHAFRRSEYLNAIRDLGGNDSPALRSLALQTIAEHNEGGSSLNPSLKILNFLSDSYKHEFDLTKSNLSGCTLNLMYSEIGFINSNWDDARMLGTFNNCYFDEGAFKLTGLFGNFNGCRFESVNLDQAIFVNPSFLFCQFVNVKMTNGSLNENGVIFTNCMFEDVNFAESSDFARVQFKGTNMIFNSNNLSAEMRAILEMKNCKFIAESIYDWARKNQSKPTQ